MPAISSLLNLYQDPRFWLVSVASVLVSMAAFISFAAALTWIAAKDPAWARRWRIQNPRGSGRLSDEEATERGILVQGRHMIQQSIHVWLKNNLWMLAAATASWPLLSLSGMHAGALPALWVIVAQLLFFIYLDDFLYYWMHRAMHTRWLLKHVHGIHHRVLAPWAITGNYMHPLEYVLTGTLMLLGPALLGSHVVVFWIWVVFRQWEAAEGHCGYAFPWSPTHWLPFSHGALHHDFHHARVRGNFGGFLPLWDKIFDTYVRDYKPAIAQWRMKHQKDHSE